MFDDIDEDEWTAEHFRRALNSDENRCLLEDCINGYSVQTFLDDGKEYRYEEWVMFNYTSQKPFWKRNFGTVLMDLTVDPDENINRAGYESYADVQAQLK